MASTKNSRVKVQQILRECTKRGIEILFPDESGWDVIEFANASFQTADKIVLMNFVGQQNVGWEHSAISAGNIEHHDWLEEQRWQLHVILKRPEHYEDETILAEDVASMLVGWFNGPGCAMLREIGLACLRIDKDDVLVYNDNSNLYQKRAVFTVKLHVPKEFKTPQATIEAMLPKIKPV